MAELPASLRPRDPMAAAWRALGWGVAVTALVLLAVRPLVELGAAALAEGPAGVVAGLRGERTLVAIGNTLWTSAVVTGVALAGALAAAVVTERLAVPGRRLLRLGVLVPLVVPPYVSALSWARAYGPAGLTDRLLGVEVPGLHGPAGIVAVTVVNTLPLAYLVVVAALRSRAEPDLERAARASGAGPFDAFRTVTLPLLRPSLVGAGALVFVMSANSFGVPAVLGRPVGFGTVTTRIYEDLVLSADPAAFTRVLVLAGLLVVLALAVALVADAAVGLRSGAVRTGGSGGAQTGGRRRLGPALALGGVLLVAVVIPLAALVLVALTRALGLPPTPAHWTLDHLTGVLDPTTRAAAANSLRLAAVTAAAVTALGCLLTALGARGGGRAVASSALLTFAVPGSALAVAVLLAYGRGLRDTLALIAVAYVAKLWAVGHRTVAAAADGLPPDLLRAARSSGAGPATTAATVAAPLLRPAILAAAVLTALFAVHELTMSSLLYGPGSQTLAVVILNLNQLGDVQATAALAVLVTVGPLLLAAPVAGVAALRRSRGRAA